MFVVRVALGALLVSLALSIIGGSHYYLVNRLVLDPGLATPWRELWIGVILGLALLAIFLPAIERSVGPPFSRAVAWPASIWMGLFFLLLVAQGASDLLFWLLGGGEAIAAESGAIESGTLASDSGAGTRALAVVAVSGIAAGAGMLSALRPPRLERVEIPLARWPRALDGYRIVQISDIHIGPILDRRFAEHVAERCNALEPDLIAVTGDLVDGAVHHLRDDVAPFGKLEARDGVFFVTGNHDHYSGAKSWVECVSELGLRPLRNAHVTISPLTGQGEAFELAGVDDYRGGHFDGEREDLDAALEGCDPERAVLLMAHDPTTFKKASQYAVDLQLSGHTHAGQIWPFRYLVRAAVPFVAGRYARNGSELYVSKGTGFWGPPMRLFAPAEITEITLRSA